MGNTVIIHIDADDDVKNNEWIGKIMKISEDGIAMCIGSGAQIICSKGQAWALWDKIKENLFNMPADDKRIIENVMERGS